MVFNVQITRIAENPPTHNAHTPKKQHNRQDTAHRLDNFTSLITVPTGTLSSKFPVRVFKIQPQE